MKEEDHDLTASHPARPLSGLETLEQSKYLLEVVRENPTRDFFPTSQVNDQGNQRKNCFRVFYFMNHWKRAYSHALLSIHECTYFFKVRQKLKSFL